MTEHVRGRRFLELVEVMERLLAPGGCPWDREQTHETLKPFLVEETYEVLDAIDRGDDAELRAELGDLLLQVVFHAELARGQQRFDIDAVCEGIRDKLVRRHPHVFADPASGLKVEAADSQAVLTRWEQIKAAEKRVNNADASAVEGVPAVLPALLRARRIQEKAARTGFDWPDAQDVLSKVEEEARELRQAIASNDRKHIEDEAGDLLFGWVNFLRKAGVDPEDALRRATHKFEGRFRAMESRVRAEGREMAELPLDVLEAYWSLVKSNTRG